MAITLGDLIEELQVLIEENPELEDQEVLIAYQENYPLAATISEVTLLEPEDDDDDQTPTVWLATRDHNSKPYAPRAAWSR